MSSATDDDRAVDDEKTSQKFRSGDGSEPVAGSHARRRLELCHCHRELFAVKVFYFAFFASYGVILKYSAVFYKQHGLSAFEIGIIAGVRPLIGFLSAPLWGAVADRYVIRRFLMLVSLLAWLAFFISLYTVGEPERRAECPQSWWPFLQRGKLRMIMDRDLPDDNWNASFQLPTTGGVSRRGTILFAATVSGILVNTASFELQTMHPRTFTFSSSPDDENIFATGLSSMSGGSNSSLLGDDEQALLREDLEWLYKPTSRFHVFIFCLVIIIGGEFFQSPTTAMADTTTLQILGRERLEEYGAQRAWGQIGWAIGAFVTGSVLNAVQWNEVGCGVTLHFTNYHVVTYIFIPLMTLSLVAAVKINFATEQSKNAVNEKTNLARDDASNVRSVPPPSHQHSTLAVVKVFLNLRNGSWLLTLIIIAIFTGLKSSFLYWHLENIGGSKLLMGINSALVGVSEFLTFFIADYIIKLVGRMGVFYVELVSFAMRFIVYASTTNPWVVLSMSAPEGVMFALVWVSVSQYSALLVPSTSLGTIQGIIHGVYYGLGYGVGSFLGGVLIGQFGAVVAFYGVAVATIVWLIVFVACQRFSKEPTNPFAYQDMSVDDGAKSLTGSEHFH